eukprot:6178550-Pleurochrysis_carterae.AAC.5
MQPLVLLREPSYSQSSAPWLVCSQRGELSFSTQHRERGEQRAYERQRRLRAVEAKGAQPRSVPDAACGPVACVAKGSELCGCEVNGDPSAPACYDLTSLRVAAAGFNSVPPAAYAPLGDLEGRVEPVHFLNDRQPRAPSRARADAEGPTPCRSNEGLRALLEGGGCERAKP